MSKYYIYKYVANDQIIYVGQSTNLVQRIAQHKIDKLKDISANIYFFECENQTAMNSWEYFLINKYHPKYNIALNNSAQLVDVKEPEWILYQEELFKNMSKKINNNEKDKTHKTYNVNLNILNNNFNTNINNSSSNFIYNFYNTQMLEQRIMLYLLVKSRIQNIDIDIVSGTTYEYLKFLNIPHTNIYNQIKDIIQNSGYLYEDDNNNFKLTKEGINQFSIFIELDLETLISIIKNAQCKYTCFILNLLLQTEDFCLFFEDLYSFLPPSYQKYNHLKNRVILPVIEDLQLVGFNVKYNPQKTNKKYTHINFI